MPKASPTWLDEILQREKISYEDYYKKLATNRISFWSNFWTNLEKGFRFERWAERITLPLRPAFSWKGRFVLRDKSGRFVKWFKLTD